MIDINKSIEQFKEYTKNFDLTNVNILRKYEHSIRVMEISKFLATKLKFNEEQINIATLIGLLHDIGRFEQFTQYGTFRDIDSVDHGKLGVNILEENDLIRKFIQEDKYDNIIKKAILNHNKLKIEENLTDEELVFAKLIRDSDKIDILFEAETIFYEKCIDEISNSKIDKEIEEQIRAKTQIARKKGYIPQGINMVLGPVSFIYDINYEESLKLIKEKNYINNIFNKFKFTDKKTKEKIEEIREEVNGYIEENIK